MGVPFTSTYMKGRGNYLCLHRFDAYRDAALNGGAAPGFTPTLDGFSRGSRAEPADETIYIRLIEEWRRETQTGDRAEIEDLPEDLPFWKEIAATSENCIGAECPQHHECFVTRMRQRAAESDVVIVNHHLLCADAAVRQSEHGEVIPDCRYAIVDEAHQLEDVATQYFGIAVSNYRVDDLARDVERAVGAKLVPDQEQADGLADDAERVRNRAREFFGAVQMVRFDVPGVGGGDSRVRVGPSQTVKVADQASAFLRALEALEAGVALAREAPVDVLALGTRAAELRKDLAFLLRADDAGFVYYLEVRGRGVILRASPIDVSAIVRELLIDRMTGTVLTSATLTVDGSFEYVRGRLGIRRAQELRLASEFDYARQAILYLPKRMPDPRSREFAAAAAREVVEIVKRTRGRAFVLFTSYATLREVEAIASDEIEYPILVQGAAPRSVVAARFQGHAERRAAGDLQLLAGRRCRRRSAELRHHRQAAVRVPRGSDHGRTHRGHHGARRIGVRRVPDSARRAGAHPGTRAAAAAPPGSRCAGRPRSAASHDGLRPPVSRLAAARACHPRSRRHRAVPRSLPRSGPLDSARDRPQWLGATSRTARPRRSGRF